MFLRTQRDSLLAVAQIKRIEEKADAQRNPYLEATRTDGRTELLRGELIDDIEFAIAPVLPAQPGHVVLIAWDVTEGSDEAVRVAVSLHDVACFKVVDGRAIPIVVGFDLQEHDHVLHSSPSGTLTDISEQRVFSGFYAWLDAVTQDMATRSGKPLNMPVRKIAA